MQFHFARWRVPVAAFVAAFALAGAAQAQLRAPKPAATPALPREPGPTTIDADYIEGIGGQETTARGNAELRQDDTVIFGDFLRYNQEFGRIEADGACGCSRATTVFRGRACVTTAAITPACSRSRASCCAATSRREARPRESNSSAQGISG